MKRKVVIITDCTDVAYLEIRGAIYSNTDSDDFEIEPIVKVEDFNITNVSFLVRLIAEIYPEGTLINVVVHPSQLRGERIVGQTERKGIIFEGTNTGAFGWLLKDFGYREVYELYDMGFVPFGGKYVHAPAVGKILSGCPLEKLGNPFQTSMVRDVERSDGTILHIDNFGNIKFVGNVKGENGDKYTIIIGKKKFQAIYWERMMERNDVELVIYPGSSFLYPEIGIVRGNAAKILKIKWSDKIICIKSSGDCTYENREVAFHEK